MEREIQEESLSDDQIDEMEEKRIEALNEAGIVEEEVLRNANKHMNTWNSYFNENITRGKDDLNFVLRDQWTAVERSEFTRLFKPAMTFNKLYDSIKKIVGEQRKNKPDLIVRSLTGKATQEQISLRADLVRTISYQSQNDLVYQTAFKSALMMGFGAFQICLDYENAKSFKRIIRYEMIPDATRCFWDPTALRPHKGDGNFCGRFYVFTRDEFFATYPYVTNPVSYIDPYMLLDFQWNTRDTITVCDYFVKEWYPEIIYDVFDGESHQSATEKEWKEIQKSYKQRLAVAGDAEVRSIIEKEEPHIVSQRQTEDYRIMHYRMIRNQIIEFSEWPSKQLPIIFVDGDSYFIEGRQYTKSFIHEARDAQKALNYAMSETMAEIKNRRREQWIGTPDNIIGYEQDWRNPELQMGILRAKPDPKTGQMPQKMPAWEVSQGLFTVAASTNQSIREILGFSEQEALQGKDISGKARRERKMEGSMSAYVFFDNLNQSVEQGGRVVNDLLPYVVGDKERHMVISKKDGKTDNIILNQNMGDGKVANKIDKGEFDVEIDTGPSFAVQKDIALEFFQQTISNNPQVFNLIADLWAGNLDIEQMELVKDRLKTLVPPQILAKEEGKPLPPPKPSPQEMMMQAEMQEKQAQIQVKMKEVQLKQQQLELDKQKLMLEAHKVNMDAELDVYNHQSDLAQAKARHDLDHKKVDHDFTAKMAGLLTDHFKHTNPQEKPMVQE